MTTNREIIELVQAEENRKQIEFRCIDGGQAWGWKARGLGWDFVNYEYRIKPEPREWYVWVDPHGVVSSLGNHSGVGVAQRVRVREVP